MAAYGYGSRFHDGRVINTKNRVITMEGVITLVEELKGPTDGNQPDSTPVSPAGPGAN